HPALVRFLVKLRGNFVARIASAPAGLLAIVLRQRIATLNHESFDLAMERSAVVEAGLRELLKILHGLRRDVWPKLGHHFAFTSFDHCDFLWFTHGGGFLLFLFF